jgi:hypothetical protein
MSSLSPCWSGAHAMPKIHYVDTKFKDTSLAIIEKANEILEDYTAQGYELTLRQLYYQFVARGLIPNNQKEYDKLGSIISDARLAGLIDWDHIVDRTRSLRGVAHWDDPAEIIQGAANSFRIDKWADQSMRVEVWIEKDALLGIIERPCRELDVSYFSCRGYVSQSEMWSAATERILIAKMRRGQFTTILHLGDHDPSGIDMTRDIKERMAMFKVGNYVIVERIALNMDQVQKYKPPPNPTKLSDVRAEKYIEEYGDESWELDALEPSVITALIVDHIEAIRDDKKWNKKVKEEEIHRKQLAKVSEQWEDVIEHLDT